jgi:Flp pilus assembly pilin Flp
MEGWARRNAKKFLGNEEGQNLSEYCLITAVIAIVALVIIVAVSGGLHNIWQLASSTTSVAIPGGGGAVAGK